MSTVINERNLTKLLTGRFMAIVGACLLSLIAICVLDFNKISDPLLNFVIISTAMLFMFKVIGKAASIPVIPCLFLQLLVLSMFLDKNITAISGISLKLYTITFGVATASAIIYIFKNFKQLWSNYPIFRYFFIFFIINTIYSFCYYSDFRSFFSNYLNDLYLSKSSTAKYFAIMTGTGLTQEFTETKFGIYLFGLAPIIALTVSLMIFQGINKINLVREKLTSMMKYLSIAISSHLTAAALTILAGLAVLDLSDQGRLDTSFLGISGGVDLFLALFFLMFIGFKIYLNTLEQNKNSKLISNLIQLTIPVMTALILLSINKTCIISLSACLLFIGTMLLMTKIYSIKTVFKSPAFIITLLSAFALFAIIIMINPDLVTNITKRFSTVETLNTRGMMWKGFIQEWFTTLTPFNIFFGHGIDSSRELTFKISSMIGENNAGIAQPHIHNMILQMFYDYGAMALLYFGGLLSVVASGFKSIFSPKASKEVKIISITSLSLVGFFFIYHMSYVIKIPPEIIFFSLLGFLESAKFALEHGKTSTTETIQA